MINYGMMGYLMRNSSGGGVVVEVDRTFQYFGERWGVVNARTESGRRMSGVYVLMHLETGCCLRNEWSSVWKAEEESLQVLREMGYKEVKRRIEVSRRELDRIDKA